MLSAYDIALVRMSDSNNAILHRMGEQSVIDRGQFDDEKSRYWQDRFKMFSDAELKKIYG